MSVGPDARHLVAGILRQTLGRSWTVYELPPEQVAAPAAVVAPRSPYRERSTYGLEIVNLTVALLVLRASDLAQVDELDRELDVVRAALEQGDARISVPAIGELGPVVNIGGTDHMTGRLDVTVHMTPQEDP